MKMFLLVLSLVATLNQPILLLNIGSDYNPTSFWDLGYDLNYIIDHFYNGVDKGLDIIDDFADTVQKLGIDNSPNIQVTPSVKYYNQPNNYTQNNTSYYEYKSFTQNYDNRSYSTTYNYDNRSYTYNPVYNDYRTYDYKTYKTYNYFEDNDYYYITNNNITNYEYYIVNKIDVNDNRYYSYYYELPSGSKSYNLTKDQVLGEFMSYDCYQYEQSGDSADVLALFKLNGNYQNEVSGSDIVLVYNGNSFVNGKFDGSLKLDGTIDMQMTGDFPNEYTCEFWFYNNINNGTYSGCCPPNSWCHCAYTYDDGVVRVWFNGIESTRASRPCVATSVSISPVSNTSSLYYDNKVTQGSSHKWENNTSDYGYIYDTLKLKGISNAVNSINNNLNVSVPSVFGSRLPSITVGNSSLPTSLYKGLSSYSTTRTTRSHSGTSYGATANDVVLTVGSKINLRFNNRPTFNSNDPLHYYPQFTTNGVDFGFTGHSNASGYTLNSNPRLSFEDQYTETYTNVYTPRTAVASDTSNYTSVNVNNYVDMSECLIDEIRVSNGILYNDSTFTYPQDEFTYGHIWVRPDGDDFNIGDIAIMSPVEITDYRIGGADFSYPSTGNVYVGLKNNVGYYARVYNGQNWLTCDFGVWDGSKWADGVGFNFLTLTWGQNDTPNSPTLDVNVSTDVNVTQDDKKGFTDIVGFIFELFAFIPLCIGFLTIIPTPINIILIGLIGLLTVLIVLKIIKR